jgi:hypothetical protein
MVVAIGALDNIICMIYIHPEKIEFLYFPRYVFCTSLLYVVVLPNGVSNNFSLKKPQLSRTVSISGLGPLKMIGTTTRF